MAVSKGKDATIYVHTAAFNANVAAATPGGSKVGKHQNASLTQKTETADSTSNDSGGSREHVVTFDDAELKFSVFTDEADAGQNALRAAYEGKTFIYVLYRERGDVQTAKQKTFQASVELAPETPMDNLARTSVTLRKTGAMSIGTQA